MIHLDQERAVVRSLWRAACIIVPALCNTDIAQAAGSVPPARFTDPDRRAKLEAVLPALDQIATRWAREHELPGLAWGIVIDGELARFGSVGRRDVESNAAIDADTVFRIASMTKSFTALAILMLRDERKLELDAPASRYVPELASLEPPTVDSGPVTVRQLLTHTAGFPEDNPWGDRQLAIPQETLSAWLSAGIPFSTATGSAFEYSNFGYAILGRIVANVSGMPYVDYVNRKILAPLDMTSTWWDARDIPAGRLATGYRRQDANLIVERPLADGAFGPMGGLFTSSRDLARWIGLMLSAFPPRDDAEVPPALRRSLRELQRGSGYSQFGVRRVAPGAVTTGYTASYAFGLGEFATCLLDRGIGHAGGLPGFGSYMAWLPEHGAGAFALANLTYEAPSSMVREMLERLAQSGALEPRQPVPSPALEAAAENVAGLVADWSDASAGAIAADNLFLDESLERRREAIAALRDGLGSCTAGDLRAENALRGKFRMTCERGWLDLDLTLAPTRPPRVQSLGVTGGRPPGERMTNAIQSVLAGMATGPDALLLPTKIDRSAIGALLQSYREAWGACRAGEPQGGDGTTNTRVRLECDRGPLDLTVSLDDGEISDIVFAPPPGTVCVP